MHAQKGGATLMQSGQPVTSYRKKQHVNSKRLTRAVDAPPEWLPQIAHFNISALAHKNANELKLCMHSCACISVKCYCRCNRIFM